MYIIKFSTQQHNGIFDMTNNLKIIISVRRGNLLFLQCLVNCPRNSKMALKFKYSNTYFNCLIHNLKSAWRIKISMPFLSSLDN